MDAPFYEITSDCETILVDAFSGALVFLVFFKFSPYFLSLNFSLSVNSATGLPRFWLNCRRILPLAEETWKTASPSMHIHSELLTNHGCILLLNCALPAASTAFLFPHFATYPALPNQILSPLCSTHVLNVNRNWFLGSLFGWHIVSSSATEQTVVTGYATRHDMSILDLNWNVPSFWNAQHKTAPLSGHSCSRWISFHAAIYKFTSHPDLHTRSAQY